MIRLTVPRLSSHSGPDNHLGYRSEAELKADSEKIRQMEEQRNTFTVGSKEYKDLDEELARNIAEFKLKMDKLRKSFMEREAKMYYQAYLEVNDAAMSWDPPHARESLSLDLKLFFGLVSDT